MPPCSKAHPQQTEFSPLAMQTYIECLKDPEGFPKAFFPDKDEDLGWIIYQTVVFTCFLPEDISIEGGQEVVPEVCMVTVIQQL